MRLYTLLHWLMRNTLERPILKPSSHVLKNNCLELLALGTRSELNAPNPELHTKGKYLRGSDGFLPEQGTPAKLNICNKARHTKKSEFWQWSRREGVDCNEWQGYDIRSNSFREAKPECWSTHTKKYCTLQMKTFLQFKPLYVIVKVNKSTFWKKSRWISAPKKIYTD